MKRSGFFRIEISYGTTADFEYCPVCGNFANHGEYDADEQEYYYSCGDFETITEDELTAFLNNFEETENCFVELISL